MGRWTAILLAATLAACGGDGGGEQDSGDGGAADGGADGGGGDGGAADGGGDGGAGDGGGDGGTDMPPAPEPFTLQLAGASNQALYFDTITCSKPVGSQNFRVFWRDSTGSHVFVLAAELLGTYTEPGTYTTADHNAKVKLQEEAGGSGGFEYWATDSAQGDAATIVVDYLDEEKLEVAWGEFSFDRLHGDGGQVTATPQPVPIWCDSLN